MDLKCIVLVLMIIKPIEPNSYESCSVYYSSVYVSKQRDESDDVKINKQVDIETCIICICLVVYCTP